MLYGYKSNHGHNCGRKKTSHLMSQLYHAEIRLKYDKCVHFIQCYKQSFVKEQYTQIQINLKL